jgi:hypothetical protein
MSTRNVAIQPYEYVTTSIAISMSIKIIQFVLFTSVTVHAILYDANGVIVLSTNIDITGDDYLAWSNNDSYIYEYVTKKLGVNLVTLDVSGNTK